jgi:hypothetical protein
VGVVTFGSVRSCAVTTVALALAATWPSRSDSGGGRVLLIEADPAGGTLAGSSGWPAEPSLVSLAAAARRGGDPELVWEHCQELPGGTAVLAGPASADQARHALGMLEGWLGRLGALHADVLVDCGRLDPASPVLGLWEKGERSVLVARPCLADLQAVATRLEAGSFAGDRLGLVVVGEGRYPDGEIAEALGVEVLARLPWDPDAAQALVSVPASARELRMAPLVRAARTLAGRLAAGMDATASVHAGPVHAGSVHAGPVPATEGGTASVRSRVWRAFRPEAKPAPSNGSAPEEVSR